MWVGAWKVLDLTNKGMTSNQIHIVFHMFILKFCTLGTFFLSLSTSTKNLESVGREGEREREKEKKKKGNSFLGWAKNFSLTTHVWQTKISW